MEAPGRLAAAADAAREAGRPDAVRRLADLVEHVAARKPISALAAADNRDGDFS
jgi:UDP-N-acetylglucosamine--N-acetylmuramyl-(pentapeptide) pyrophosphoryl-undecaprenol N-acetylglucosamine transferase